MLQQPGSVLWDWPPVSSHSLTSDSPGILLSTEYCTVSLARKATGKVSLLGKDLLIVWLIISTSLCICVQFCLLFSVIYGPVRKVAKIRNRYPHLTQDTTRENDKNTIKHHKQEPKGQLFPSRWPPDTKTWQTRHTLWIIQKKHCLVMVSENICTGGLKPVSQCQLTRSSDADQDAYFWSLKLIYI